MQTLFHLGKYIKQIENFCDRHMKGHPKAIYTPKGLLFIHEWAPIRYAMNVAFICGIAADQDINSCKYRDFIESQVNYVLGKERLKLF